MLPAIYTRWLLLVLCLICVACTKDPKGSSEVKSPPEINFRVDIKESPDYSLARSILSDDFITPEEVARSHEGIVYTDDQLVQFSNTIPSQEVLEWSRDNGYMVVAGPARPMSLLEIDQVFSEGEGLRSMQEFALNDKVDTRWIIFRKEQVPESTSKNWNEQQALLSEVEITPKVAEVVWCVTIYKAVRDINLLPSSYVRTSNLDLDGNRVIVGILHTNGFSINISVSNWNDKIRFEKIGMASARK